MKKFSTYKKQNSAEIYQIHKSLKCNSKNTVYLIECNLGNVGNNTQEVPKASFVIGLTIIKVLTIILGTKNKFPKKLEKFFRQHFCSDDHNGIQHWVIILIKKVDEEKFLRQRELFWAHKLDTFYPNGLNQGEIYAAY